MLEYEIYFCVGARSYDFTKVTSMRVINEINVVLKFLDEKTFYFPTIAMYFILN